LCLQKIITIGKRVYFRKRCPDRKQHTCIGLVELTDRCNLSCPMCFASSGPGGRDHSMSDIIASLDRLIATEGRAEVCQLSGGEPTLHPQFEAVVDEALARPIDNVMVNTNGIRLAKDWNLVAFLADRRDRVEIYLQWDGEDHATLVRLRGEPLSDIIGFVANRRPRRFCSVCQRRFRD